MKSALNPYALTFLCAVMCSCSKNDTNDLNADITAFHTNATQKAGLNQGSHTLSLEENEALNGNTNSMTAEGISQFDNALNASFTVLSDNLTNINLTIISNVFAGLPDPTSIILSVDKYSKGNEQQRKIAMKFFEYMADNYPEERLQACAHFMLASLEATFVNRGPWKPLNDEAFNRSINHYETVIELPSKEYYYIIALDSMAEEYLRHANLTVNNRDEMYANARKYYWKVYNESKQPWQVDRALCSMFECYATGEEKQAFYDKHVNHKFSSDQWKKEFDTLVESFGEPGKSK